ncbi:MAG: acyl carrier protein [Caldisericia bacterium]|nr:acyl carrier protein [Caldisericia bacterium]
MTKEEILGTVKTIVTDKLGVDANKVTLEARFMEDLGADSLGLVDVTMELEEKFGVSIPDEDLPKITTVGSAIDYVMSKMS